MELQRVVTIVESLAAGVDPASGTSIPHDLFHTPEVIRALFTAANLLKERVESPGAPAAVVAPASSGNRPAAAGQRWSDEEDALLCHEFDGGTPVPEIARQHGRTTSAIKLRLVKLGRIDPDTVKLRDRSQRVA